MGSAGLGGMPPSPSPAIQGQQGVVQEPPAEAGGGLGTMVAKQRQGQPAPGAPEPHGAIVAQVEAVVKVLEEMSKTEPMMAPFAARATAILQSGLSAVRSAPKGAEGGLEPPGPSSTQGMPPPSPAAGAAQGPALG